MLKHTDWLFFFIQSPLPLNYPLKLFFSVTLSLADLLFLLFPPCGQTQPHKYPFYPVQTRYMFQTIVMSTHTSCWYLSTHTYLSPGAECRGNTKQKHEM